MRDLLFQLKNSTLNSPQANVALMNRAVETLESYRALTIDMLAALSWLRAADKLPQEVNLSKLETSARELLDITVIDAPRPDQSPDLFDAVIPKTVEMIGRYDTPAASGLSALPEYKICPRCGDRNPKIVHLRRRPKAGLQCASCSYEYAFPARWI